MAKITLELNDTLQEHVDSAIEDVKALLETYLEENPDTDETPCLSNNLDYGGEVSQIIDDAVPFRTHEVKTTWFLHGDELEAAYENAGVGENPLDNDGMVAIYYYIEQAVGEWYWENAEEIFEEWYEERQDLLDEEDDDLEEDC